MKNSVRRGLFHPDDIKTFGLAPTAQGPLSAPLPGLTQRSSRPSVSPLAQIPINFGPSSTVHHGSHSRSSSLVPTPTSGSFGRAEARRIQNQSFGKYTEEDDEDYEDVFGGKINGSCKWRSIPIFVQDNH